MIAPEPYEPTKEDYDYVRQVVRWMHPVNCDGMLDFEDHVQAGYIGLLKAIKVWRERELTGCFRKWAILHIKSAIRQQGQRVTRLGGGYAYLKGNGSKVPSVRRIRVWTVVEDKRRRNNSGNDPLCPDAELIRMGKYDEVLPMHVLTPYQCKVFKMQLRGMSLGEMAKEVEIEKESVRTLLRRIHRIIRRTVNHSPAE